jgi:hypothetical protein
MTGKDTLRASAGDKRPISNGMGRKEWTLNSIILVGRLWVLEFRRAAAMDDVLEQCMYFWIPDRIRAAALVVNSSIQSCPKLQYVSKTSVQVAAGSKLWLQEYISRRRERGEWLDLCDRCCRSSETNKKAGDAKWQIQWCQRTIIIRNGCERNKNWALEDTEGVVGSSEKDQLLIRDGREPLGIVCLTITE